MRRKSSPRVVWLPPTDANSPNASPTVGYQVFNVDISMASGTATGEIPLTIDSQDDPLDPNTTLSDIESSGYRLRRIVGKIWILGEEADDESAIDAYAVTAGIIVRRSNPVDGLSYARATANANLISPAEIPNYGDPWIWRRTWVLRGITGGIFDSLPTNNIELGSGVDGPHVDQKTARIVGPESRCFLDVSCTVLFGSGQGEINHLTTVVTDLRLLASMRSSSGNRRNASR